MANRWGKSENSDRLHFLGLQNHGVQWLQLWNEKMLPPWKKSYDKPRWCVKKQRHHLVHKSPYSQNYGFSSSHVWMWELDHKEEWVLKNWCFWIVVLKKTLESPVDSKEIKPVNSKRNHSWILIGRTDTEAEAPILGPAGVKWKRPRCWERLKARGKVDDREWDGCRASLTQWTWIWANSRKK